MRKTQDELNDLMKRENVDRIWSWSRINCFRNSKYEYFLKYIKKEKEDRCDSIYTSTGGIAHNILEKYYLNRIKYEDMVGEFDDGWTIAFDVANLKFNRTDEESNERIADKYYDDLLHFFKTHKTLQGQVMIEQFVKVKINGSLIHGYIDLCYKDKKGYIHIVDFKTSSAYKGKKAISEAGQLVLYALGLIQAGIPQDKIIIEWNFLKYVNVICYKPKSVKLTYRTIKGEEKVKDKLDEDKIGSTLKATVKSYLKNGTLTKEEIDNCLDKLVSTNDVTILPEDIQDNINIEYLDIENTPRQIERSQIGKSLQNDCKKQMKKLGYTDEQINEYLDKLYQTNSIEYLPKEVQDKYIFDDCYVSIPLTDDLIDYWVNEVSNTIKDIELRELDYKNQKSDKCFWDSEQDVISHSFYFANLCSYSPNKHLPYKEYLEKQNQLQEEKDNLYSDVGSETVEVNINETNDTNDDELDLSWLNDLM